MSGDGLADLSACATGDAIRSGELDGGESLAAWSERAAADRLNAWLWNGPDHSESGVAGAPVAVKDIFCTEGIPTTAGSRILEGYLPPFDATAVARLREAGLPILVCRDPVPQLAEVWDEVRHYN